MTPRVSAMGLSFSWPQWYWLHSIPFPWLHFPKLHYSSIPHEPMPHFGVCFSGNHKKTSSFKTKRQSKLLKTVRTCYFSSQNPAMALLFTQKWMSSLYNGLQGPVSSAYCVPASPSHCLLFHELARHAPPEGLSSSHSLSLEHSFPGESGAWLTPSPPTRLAQIPPSQWGPPDYHPNQYKLSTNSPIFTKHSPNPVLLYFFFFHCTYHLLTYYLSYFLLLPYKLTRMAFFVMFPDVSQVLRECLTHRKHSLKICWMAAINYHVIAGWKESDKYRPQVTQLLQK